MFVQQPLPPRSVKEDLAQRTGLTLAQVNIWFNNQRQRAAGTDQRVKKPRTTNRDGGDAVPDGAGGAAELPPPQEAAATEPGGENA